LLVLADTVSTVDLSALLLTARSLTCDVRVASLDFTSAVVFTASVALVVASDARALAAAASSRAASICRSRLPSSSFSICSCSCWACIAWRSSSSSAAKFALVFNNSKDDKGADATRLPGFNAKAFLDES